VIIEGASRGLRLAGDLLADGHAVRVVTSAPSRQFAIEQVGAECFIGTPERLATLRGALEHVTIACWLLATACGDEQTLQTLHGSCLQRFLRGAIDSTLRGFVYEAGGSVVDAELLQRGTQIVSEAATRDSIPIAILTADPLDVDAWLTQARLVVNSLLEGHGAGVEARYAGQTNP
jgi:hypothetical protein